MTLDCFSLSSEEMDCGCSLRSSAIVDLEATADSALVEARSASAAGDLFGDVGSRVLRLITFEIAVLLLTTGPGVRAFLPRWTATDVPTIATVTLMRVQAESMLAI